MPPWVWGRAPGARAQSSCGGSELQAQRRAGPGPAPLAFLSPFAFRAPLLGGGLLPELRRLNVAATGVATWPAALAETAETAALAELAETAALAELAK